MEQEKKRHHFVPKAYLGAFCDAKGRVRVYRKDNPTKALHVDRDNTGFERYYYSQPTPDGGQDNNRLEDMFSKLEAEWPPIVERMHRREDVNDALMTVFEFMALQRVRVPASRDATEARLASSVKELFLQLHAAGELPPMPPVLEGRLDEVVVSIDPHKSIHGMVEDLQQSVLTVFDRVGICLVHNTTGLPFLTSDNPVIWFDPSVPNEEQRPYEVSEDGPVMLLFPVSPTLLLMGSDENKPMFARHGLLHTDAPHQDWVLSINETVCRYGYEAVYASEPGQEDIVLRYSAASPVHDPETGGRMTFGPRAKLPKWEARTPAE
jgi:hypothetical protein